ncbi:MAG: hypothetical protein R3C45_08135 [Phycisphaerales bacterium]
MAATKNRKAKLLERKLTMNHLTRQTGTLFAATALALGGLTLSANGAEKDLQTPRNDQAPRADVDSYQMNERDTAQGETFRGKIVNLQQFLLADADHNDDPYANKSDANHSADHKMQNQASKDAPLGLCVENEGIIGALTTEQTYLIVFDPANDTQSDAYEDARDLIGKDVAVTGKVLERGSLSGVLISKIEQATPKQAAADTTQP